jgi:hypothetical protein
MMLKPALTCGQLFEDKMVAEFGKLVSVDKKTKSLTLQGW